MSRPVRLGLVQITAAGLLWGTGGVVVRLLHDHVALGPVTVAFYRLAVAVPVLLLVGRRARLRAAVRSAPLPLVAIGAGLGAYQALYFVAVTAVGVAVATVICIGLAPVLLTAWEAARARRLEATTAAVVAVAVLGLVLVSLAGTRTGTRPLLGLLCAVGSGLGYAGTTLLGRRAAATVDPLPLTTLTTAVGALALAPLAATGGLGFPVSAGSLLALAYLGPVTTALAFALFYLGLRTTPTSTATVLTLLEPVAAAVLATVVLGDPLPATTVAGGGLILVAVAVLYRRPAAAARAGAAPGTIGP